MKKSLRISVFIGTLLLMAWRTDCLLAQEITVPDYSYEMIRSGYGTLSQNGAADPGPEGFYTEKDDQRSSSVFFAHGFRWWGYVLYDLYPCGWLPEFNYPGFHGVWAILNTGCTNPPGNMGSWGGIIADPDSCKIWSLAGAKKNNGPTAKYCRTSTSGSTQCWEVPSYWGYGSAYGYLRKVVVVQSTGVLKKGDPVNIKASITARKTHTGEGTMLSQGVLFMNKLSETEWLKWGMGREYLKWGDVEDMLGTPSMINNMLAVLQVNQNITDDSTVTVVIGDTINLELIFLNSIKHDNPGTLSEAEGWAGERPTNLFNGIIYTRTDSVKNLISKHGNTLTYDLISLTQGVLLNPLTPHGPNVDEDKDGISDAREKGADGNNSTFDGNADGTPDYKQANVASFHTYNGENYVTLAVPLGKVLSQLKVTDNPSPANKPADAEFPWGFFDFSIDGLDPGEAITVTMTLHSAIPVAKYYKYGLTPDNPESHWYDFTYNGQTGAEINGNVITLHFVDGLRGDEDITLNGSIKEPGGPAISGTTGIDELTEPCGITVYPNPATDNITLKLNNILPADNYILNIYSNTGETIQQKLINVCDANEEFVISTDNLPSGIFLISISGSNRIYKTRFIKLK